MCVGFLSFCDGGAVSSSSPPAGCGVGSCWAFLCDCSAFFLGHLRFSAACHAAGYPSRVPHLADSGWLNYSCSGRLLWGWWCLGTGVLIHHLVFYLVPVQLPLPLLPLRDSAPFLAPVRWSTTVVEPCCWVSGVWIHHLVFYHLLLLTLSGCGNLSGSSLLVYSCGGALLLGWRCLYCVTWFSTMCRALPLGPAACVSSPAVGSLGDFQVAGCLSFCFPSDAGWASALPFFFCASASAGLRGLAGFCTLCQGAPVGVVSALRSTVSSPCWLSLTLGWVSFWTAVSPVSVGCEVCGLDCPSWFVHLFMSLFVLHLLWGWGGLVTGLWPLLRLLGFGLFWCSVVPSWRLSLWPHPLLFSPRISSLGVC